MSHIAPQEPDKSARSPVVLLPGWATDGRVFGLREWPFTWNSLEGFLPGRCRRETMAYMESAGGRPLALVGWSLGGYVALEIARENPDRVGGLILMGVRRTYPAEEIESVRRAVRRDRQGFLARFYRQCFLPGFPDAYQRFKATLLDSYLEDMHVEYLIEGLDYLARQSIVPTALPDCPVLFVHGQKDAVAPVAEVRRLVREVPRAALRIIAGVGHAAFLAPGFDEEVTA